MFGEPVDDILLCVVVSTETCTLHRDSSTELCTGATAHTHEDKDHRGRCCLVKDQSPGMAPDLILARKGGNWTTLTPPRLQTPMVDYRHPPRFTHEHGCVTQASRVELVPDCKASAMVLAPSVRSGPMLTCCTGLQEAHDHQHPDPHGLADMKMPDD